MSVIRTMDQGWGKVQSARLDPIEGFSIIEIEKHAKIGILSIWLLCLLPGLFLGFGSDPDAWLVAHAAVEMQQTGHYVASRTTGFPLYEILVVPFILLGGAVASNLLSVFFGAILLWALFRIAEREDLPHPIATVSTIAFLPILMKNSVSTMDFIPALALLIWSYVFALEKRWILSAVLIGLACGFRPSSGWFLVPISVYSMSTTRGARVALEMSTVSILVGVAAYSPVLLEYGYLSPFMSVRPDLGIRTLAGGYSLLRLFGIGQSIFLAALCLHVLRTRNASLRTSFRDPAAQFHAANIVAWMTLFALLPAEPEYLLPMVPSVVFLLSRFVDKRLFLLTSFALLTYHVVQVDVLGGESGRRTLRLSIEPGYTIQDVDDRIFKLSTRRAASECQLEKPTVLMLGVEWIPVLNDGWEYESQSGLYHQKNGNLFLAPRILDEARLQRLSTEGFRIVLWQHAKWEYFRSGSTHLLRCIDVVGDLGVLLGRPISGKAMTQS